MKDSVNWNVDGGLLPSMTLHRLRVSPATPDPVKMITGPESVRWISLGAFEGGFEEDNILESLNWQLIKDEVYPDYTPDPA